MKPFDLEAAKRGEKVITRRGLPVRILCFDRKGVVNQEIIALAEAGSAEFVWAGTSDGKSWDREEQNDLFMMPETITLHVVTWLFRNRRIKEEFESADEANYRAKCLRGSEDKDVANVKVHEIALEV